MKTSVLIIAHNEEAHIEHCIVSILHQTQEADQIVLIAHNCTDRTIEIAQAFPITVIPYNGPVGITHARIEGLTHVRGDIILCIDGDSWAAKNWIHEMCWILQQGNVLVGSWVQLRGNVFGWISNFSIGMDVSKEHRCIDGYGERVLRFGAKTYHACSAFSNRASDVLMHSGSHAIPMICGLRCICNEVDGSPLRMRHGYGTMQKSHQ